MRRNIIISQFDMPKCLDTNTTSMVNYTMYLQRIAQEIEQGHKSRTREDPTQSHRKSQLLPRQGHVETRLG